MNDLNINVTDNIDPSLSQITDTTLTTVKALEMKGIERNIELVVLHAIEYGIQYTTDFVQFLADDSDKESADDVAEILDGIAEESAEYAFDKIDEKSALATHIQALKNAMKNTTPNQRAGINIYVNLS